jgi:hypothetical protein
MAGALHGMETVWARHGMCELAFRNEITWTRYEQVKLLV